jgi:hypothetical protein
MDDSRQAPLRFGLRSIFVLIAVVALLLTAFRLWPVDGVIVGLDAYTVFADGYSNSGWKSIRLGASRRDVYTRLGLPAHVISFADERTVEEWSDGVVVPGRYRRRALGFKDDKVVFIKAEIGDTRSLTMNAKYPARAVFE